MSIVSKALWSGLTLSHAPRFDWIRSSNDSQEEEYQSKDAEK